MALVVSMIVGLLSMPSATVFALARYLRHRRAVPDDRRVTIGAFVGIGLLVAFGLYFAAATLSIDHACSRPRAGNLCGMIGAVVIGPIVASLGIVIVSVIGLPVAARRR